MVELGYIYNMDGQQLCGYGSMSQLGMEHRTFQGWVNLCLNQGLNRGCTKTGKFCVSTRDGTEFRSSY